jgi:hypothetical protein
MKMNKSKIPAQFTEREELFMNMQYAKQDRNVLRDENTRLATRVKFLEGQLLIKDKIF